MGVLRHPFALLKSRYWKYSLISDKSNNLISEKTTYLNAGPRQWENRKKGAFNFTYTSKSKSTNFISPTHNHTNTTKVTIHNIRLNYYTTTIKHHLINIDISPHISSHLPLSSTTHSKTIYKQ